MPGRILTLQRQVRELGRLRAGLSVPSSTPGKLRPQSSPNWILTSPNRDYIDAAAAIWGGPVDLWQPLGNGPKVWRVITERPRIPAILPPGDPLNQAYEMWSAGGCQRRCDGEIEQRTQQPCLCRAQFGDDIHLVPSLGPDKKPQRCQIHTRLSVFLPDLPDIGMWRVETHGYWPSVRITGYVEFIKGQVGTSVMVPIGLGIEPRTKVTDGKTSHYVEIVVSLWNPVTFGEIAASPQVLAIGGPADDRTIEAPPERPAIGAAPSNGTGVPEPVAADAVDWLARFAAASTMDELRDLWRQAGGANALDEDTRKAWHAKGMELKAAARGAEPTEQEETAEPEPEPDREAAWNKVLALAGERGWDLDTTAAKMRDTVGKDQYDGDGFDFTIFAEQIEAGRVA
jgi:hypothetical protein